MSFLLSSLIACMLLHVIAIALTGAVFGVKIREIVIGLGPTAFTIAKVRVKALPFGGAVRFKDTREEDADPSDTLGTLDGRPMLVQLLIGLSGCLALIALAIITNGAEGMQAFIAGFGEIITGALSPLGTAQELLAAARERVAGLPFAAVLGLVAAKLAAFNLLPLPGANGGFLIATLARAVGADKAWPAPLTVPLLLLYLAIGISWVVALVVFLLR